MPTEYRPPIRRKLLGYAVALLAVFAVAAIWRFTPLRKYLDLQRVVMLGRALRGHPAAPLLVLCAYLVGALLFFPITLLLSATALVFDPVRGLIYGYTSAPAAAVMTYGIGRQLRRPGARWLEGPRLSRIRDQLAAPRVAGQQLLLDNSCSTAAARQLLNGATEVLDGGLSGPLELGLRAA